MDSGVGSENSSIASSPRSAETTPGTAATPQEDFENALEVSLLKFHSD